MPDWDGLLQINRMAFRGGDSGGAVRIVWLKLVKNHTNEYVITPRVHYHNFFELHFVLRGTVTYRIEDQTMTVRANQYAVIAPGQKHSVVGFSDDFVKLSVGASCAGDAINRLLARHGGKKAAMNAAMKETIRFMERQCAENNFYTPQLIKNRVFELMCLIAGACKSEHDAAAQNREADGRLTLAKQLIASHSGTFIKAADVAAACHISEKQLGRIFKKYEGKTLLSYIHDAKIAQAQKLLSEGDDSLKKISEALGFSSEYYFNLFFKKKTGMTPGDYRKAQPESR